MPTLTKKLKHFKRNKIQKRLYAVAVAKDLAVDDIMENVSEATGVSRKKLTHFTNNSSQPSLDEICLIAQSLDCKVDDLIELK